MNLFPLNSEIIKLSNFQISLEKSVGPTLERFKKISDCNLYELFNDLENRRQNDWNLLQVRIKDVFEPLKYKMDLIKNNALGTITDFKQFKKEMIAIQDNIQNLKYDSKKQIELLDNEAKDLLDDLDFYNEKMLEWTEPIHINLFIGHNSQIPKKIKSKHQCKEVKEFMDFVHASGGHENGWRREDHYLFIKFRKKFKNIDIIAQNLHEELPDISVDEIKQHEGWYQKYINLDTKKRNALKLWQKEKANRISSKKYSNIPSKVATIIQPSEDMQEKIIKWKAQKEEQAKLAKQIELYKKQKRTEVEELKKKRYEELKTLVQEWKQRRQNSEEQEIVEKKIAAERDKKRRILEANRLIKHFRSQDDLYIMKMRQKKKSEPPPVARSKSSHSAKRDLNRLLKPTQQWMNRVHDESSSDKFGRVMPLTSLPKLAIPEWRRKLD